MVIVIMCTKKIINTKCQKKKMQHSNQLRGKMKRLCSQTSKNHIN